LIDGTNRIIPNRDTTKLLRPYRFSTSFKPAAFEDGDVEEYVAVCVAIKGQADDFGEWLAHHYHHNDIRRFYIMDDGTSPPLSAYDWSAFVDPRAVSHYYVGAAVRSTFQQLTMYNLCIHNAAKKHRWMAFIDADEFFEVKGNETLQSILREFDNDPKVAALGVNWEIHTSSGLLKRPQSARKAFTTCIEDADPNHPIGEGHENEHIKSIVRTDLYDRPMHPHKFTMKDKNAKTVGEHGDVIDRFAWRVPITRDRISLHHYQMKSREEFEAKIARGNGMTDPKKWDHWDRIEGLPNRECKEMATYEP
jgi:hypothetical protein